MRLLRVDTVAVQQFEPPLKENERRLDVDFASRSNTPRGLRYRRPHQSEAVDQRGRCEVKRRLACISSRGEQSATTLALDLRTRRGVHRPRTTFRRISPAPSIARGVDLSRPSRSTRTEPSSIK